jgi:putative peptide zinc metalloprotease protein
MSANGQRIGSALRRDLIVSHQRRDGADRAIVKDPLTLRFFDLRWSDWEMAMRIPPGATAPEIVARWRRDLPAHCHGSDDSALERRAVRLCRDLRRLGLCEAPARAATATTRMKWSAWALRLARRIAAPLFLRVRLADPDAFLTALVAAWRPLFSRPALLIAAVVVVLTAIAAAAHADAMALHAGWFRVWQNLAALYLGILVLKLIHEAGHALVCKALGGQVPEVGAQMLAFHPTFFVDVSDTWMWPERRRRIAVAAAGFGAELLAACALFWLWRLLAPGFARDLCLHLLFLATVSALLFNANPLMRYDGYHILADLWREPHLRRDAFATVAASVRRLVFGADPAARARRRRGRLALYALASTAYLAWIVWIIAGFLEQTLAPLGLEGVGRVLMAAWLIGMLVPVAVFLRQLAVEVVAARRWRPVLAVATALAAVGGAAFLHVPVRVERACVVEVPAAGVLRAAEPGVIAEMLVREGERVERGQPVARLANPALALAESQAALEVGHTQVALLSAAGDNRAAEVEQRLRHFHQARARSEQAARRRTGLELVSPCDGVVVTRQPERRRGQRVQAGDEILSIAPTDARECLLPLDEKEARRIHEGATIALRLRTSPGTMHAGRITAPPLRLAGDALPPALTALAGGDIAVDAAGQVFSSEVTHVARFTIASDPRLARPGATGRARLDCGTQPAWRWLWEAALDAIHLDHRI